MYVKTSATRFCILYADDDDGGDDNDDEEEGRSSEHPALLN